MENTKIEWCDSTWNPVTGCYHDCPYCYARSIATRFTGNYDKKVKKPDIIELTKPVLNDAGKRMAYPTAFIPTFHKYRLDEYKNKTSRTIFVCSMADLFGKWVTDNWIENVFQSCADAPQHKYLFLTKNPLRYLELGEKGKLLKGNNIWYGSTVPTPETEFFWGKGFNTFMSIEPILEPFGNDNEHINLQYTQWVILGAETGNRKNKVVPEKSWIDDIVSTCIRESIPIFMKDSLIPIMGEDNMIREYPWVEWN